MSTTSKWSLSKEEQQRYIHALSEELAPLRVKAGITQGELAYLVGVSRQTYSAIENGKRQMSWATYLALVLFFDYNLATHQRLRAVNAFPEEPVSRFNNGLEPFLSVDWLSMDDKRAREVGAMLHTLDAQGLHALETVLLLEYARCTKTPPDAVAKTLAR